MQSSWLKAMGVQRRIAPCEGGFLSALHCARLRILLRGQVQHERVQVGHERYEHAVRALRMPENGLCRPVRCMHPLQPHASLRKAECMDLPKVGGVD